MKPVHHFALKSYGLYNLDPNDYRGFGIYSWSMIIAANQNYGSNILANHIWHETEVFRNPITGIVTLRKLRTCIRPVGKPFDPQKVGSDDCYIYH